MFISQKTVQHQYKSNNPPWYSSGQKTSSYNQKNQKDCKPNCSYRDGELVKLKEKGDIKVQNPPIEVKNEYKGQIGYSEAKVGGQYGKAQKYESCQTPLISGTGQRVQTRHYIDSSCPQSKQKQDHKQSKQSSPQSEKKQNNKQSNNSSQKQNKGKQILALGLVAVGGYVGSYFILKKSFEEEIQRPKSEQRKAFGNMIVHCTAATGGTVGGAIYGAQIGAIAGPVGAFIGAGFGMLVGSATGYGLKKIMPWNW